MDWREKKTEVKRAEEERMWLERKEGNDKKRGEERDEKGLCDFL